MDANEKSVLNSIEEQKGENKSCGIASSVGEPEILSDSLQAPYSKKRNGKKIIIPIVVVAALILALGLFKIFDAPTVTAIAFSKTSLNLNVGDSVTIDYTIDPEDAHNVEVVWDSSDESVAIVDKTGKITAVGDGICIVTISAQDVTASLNVSVTELCPEEKTIIGLWKGKVSIVDGKHVYNESQVILELSDDLTGRLSLEEGDLIFRWTYWKTDDKTLVYNAYTPDGLPYILTYDVVDGEENLIVIIDSENAYLFLRKGGQSQMK